jgi:serine/threonine protein kinase
MENLPDKIGHYTVDRRLGSGGMGDVYLAYSPAGEPIAIKLIRPDRLNEQTRARFEQEALKARTVVHTGRVAQFLSADPYSPRPWLAMQYIPGATLGSFVDRVGALPAVMVASLGALLAEGLSVVHDAGLLHRDLKPANVILGDSGPVIIDFGLAAFADAASSPEQAAGQTRVTTAADVYGLGVVLLYAATGHFPYLGESPQVVVARVASSEITPDMTGLPAELARLIEPMFTHEPTARPTVTEVAQVCAEIILAEGRTTVRARRALLAHIAAYPDPEAAPDPYSISPSLEARIDAEAAALVAQAAPGLEMLESPLDGSPGMFESMLRSIEGPGSLSEEPLDELPPVHTPTPPPAETPPKRSRVPAAQRIAEELRTAYARSGAL